MANATEVNRARNQIQADRAPNSATAEERVLIIADAGSAAYQQADNVVAVQVPITVAFLTADTWVYVAPGPCRVLSIKEVHSVVGGAAAAVRFRKVTADGVAPGAAAAANVIELSTSIDLTTTVNTVQTPTLSSTATDLILATGDRIGADVSGAAGSAAGIAVITLSTSA